MTLASLGAGLQGPEARAEGSPAVQGSDWKTVVSAVSRVSQDTNVFLQDTAPDQAIAASARPRAASLVAAVGASIVVSGHLAPDLGLSATYAPEASYYDNATSENNIVHRASLALTGSRVAMPWALQNSLTWIDGSKEGPTFGCPGGVPAVGGIPLRDRRAAVILRSSFKLTRAFGPWFVRPVASLYAHDFRTRQRRTPGYENYIDRQEWIGGADFGRGVGARTRLLAGFRYGWQSQFRLNGVDSPYDSQIRRFLVGVEGTPLTGLQIAALAGPETRTFAPGTPAGFNRHHTIWWIDASATLAVGPRDTVTAAVRRFEQPAFSSPSVYEDLTYDVSWRHTITARASAAVGFKAYNGDWQAPVIRDDWIYTPSVTLQIVVSSRCGLELTYARDRAVSRMPNTPGREYRRELGSVSAKYTF